MREFRILTVCSGNLCRSPVAEQVLRRRLGEISTVTVASAGTIARPGDSMPPEAAAMSRRLGGEPSAHRAGVLTEHAILNAQLVLAMAREHRRGVVSMVPRSTRYTFTVREFARLAEGVTDDDLAGIARLPLDDEVSRLESAVTLIGSRRGMVVGPEDPFEDDVIDPFRRSEAVYAQAEAELAPALEAVARFLCRAGTQTSA